MPDGARLGQEERPGAGLEEGGGGEAEQLRKRLGVAVGAAGEERKRRGARLVDRAGETRQTGKVMRLIRLGDCLL